MDTRVSSPEPLYTGWLFTALALAPPALLVLVACVQIFLTRSTALTPWKGGGFGMFATNDGNPFRYVRLFVDAPDRSEELEIAPSLEDLAARAQALPGAAERRKGRPVETVRVEVWWIDFARGTLKATDRLLRQHQFHAYRQMDSAGR
jgi:hypothetical protein